MFFVYISFVFLCDLKYNCKHNNHKSVLMGTQCNLYDNINTKLGRGNGLA